MTMSRAAGLPGAHAPVITALDEWDKLAFMVIGQISDVIKS